MFGRIFNVTEFTLPLGGRTGGWEDWRLGGLEGGRTGGHLLVEVDELLVWQLECLYGLEHSVPVAVVDVGREGVLGVHRVQRDRRLLLQGRRLRVFVFVAL